MRLATSYIKSPAIRQTWRDTRYFREGRERERGSEKVKERQSREERERRRKRSTSRMHNSILTCAYLIYTILADGSRAALSYPYWPKCEQLPPLAGSCNWLRQATSLKRIVATATLDGGQADTQQRFALRLRLSHRYTMRNHVADVNVDVQECNLARPRKRQNV